MKLKINVNAVNQFSKNTEIYLEGEAVHSIALILKGQILVHNNGAKFMVNSGVFIGVNDLYEGTYQSTYTVHNDAIVYVFSANRVEELETVLSINKDYHGFMVASLNRIINELEQIYQGLTKGSLDLYRFLTEQYKNYVETSKNLGYNSIVSKRMEELTILESDLELVRDRINYYKECAGLPIDVVKAFYSYGNTITLYQIEDQVDIINRQIEELKNLAESFAKMTECLIDESETCLFNMMVTLAIEMENSNGSNKLVMDVMDIIIEKINQIETFYERMLGYKLDVNRMRMEEAYHLVLSGTKGREINTQTILKHSQAKSERILKEMTDSFHKLVEYSEIDAETAKAMEEAMYNFVNLRDRQSPEDNARAIRRKLTENHYILYKNIFVKAYRDKSLPRMVDMFLKYGYADERLLSKDDLISLYLLESEVNTSDTMHIYNIKEWLTLIYEEKRQPSKNEFDLEYPEMLATLKKQGHNEKELLEWSTSADKKLEYEIQNMFRYNNKTTNGQISTFVPVLHMDMFVNQFDKSYVSPIKVIYTMMEILRVDYSIYDREVLFQDKNKKIVKEYIIKKVYPDIILMPTVGTQGIMWQEITGKRRDSSGRFLLPAFCETSLHAIMVRVFGRFRWEMCRTIEGTAWNDIKHKSLTSEYSDYLQFYRKNRELSEEKKEKLKLQIQRGRNSREIFVIDYEQWINYESGGAIKLNKPVRELLATYCPFSKEIREQLQMQPLFEEAMARYQRDKLKKIREIEGRHRLLMKEQIELTKELIDTLNYYKEC
ncbi:MAG TPA: hypothetical protein VJZ06_09855 [Mobilitalea sp.]|nr:hypothetical protein [Mobilitalea sp.]